MIAFPPTVIFGEGRITVGAGTTIGPLASISAGMPSQADLRGDPVIVIGDRCTLGKGIGIVGHERIEIGNDIWTGHYVYVTDQNHGYEDLDLPIGTQMWHNEPVSIGDGSWLGHGAVVLPGSKIGRHVVIAAGAVVAGIEVPDYSVVAGVPARVIRRYVDGIWRKSDGQPPRANFDPTCSRGRRAAADVGRLQLGRDLAGFVDRDRARGIEQLHRRGGPLAVGVSACRRP